MNLLSSWLPEQWPKCIVMIERLTEEEAGQATRQLKPIGTGFVLDYRGINVLMTCRHVAEKENIFITSNAKPEQAYQLITKSMSQLLESPNVSLCFHPDSNVDLAAMPFPFNPVIEDILRVLLNLFEDFENLSEGDDIFFLGFPLGIIAQRRITPLVRSGIISLKKEDYSFLIDANVFPGNSGSPVFLRPSMIDWKTRSIGKIRPPKLIGIIQSYLTYRDIAVSKQTGRPRIMFEENSALAQVYSTRLIMEFLESTELQTLVERIISQRRSPPSSNG